MNKFTERDFEDFKLWLLKNTNKNIKEINKEYPKSVWVATYPNKKG